jgi:hypothetical protein
MIAHSLTELDTQVTQMVGQIQDQMFATGEILALRMYLRPRGDRYHWELDGPPQLYHMLRDSKESRRSNQHEIGFHRKTPSLVAMMMIKECLA